MSAPVPKGAAAAELARARTFIRGIDERAATRVEPSRFGTAYFHDRLPGRWSLNFLRVEADAEELDVGELVAEADRIHERAGLEHRMLVFFDQAAGIKAARSLEPAGWRVQVEAVMAFRGQEPERTSPGAREVDAAELHRTRELTIRALPEVRDEESVRQLLEAEEIIATVTERRCFASFADRAVTSFCDVYSDGATAQIENVGTLPEFRKRGYARAVLSRALAAVGPFHELTFLLAVDDDWPKAFYARMGFEEVGLNYSITRDLRG